MILAILVFYTLFYKLFIHLNTLPTDYRRPAGESEYIGTWEPPYFDQEGSGGGRLCPPKRLDSIKIYVISEPTTWQKILLFHSNSGPSKSQLNEIEFHNHQN